MTLYLSYCEVCYEGSYVMGIYLDLLTAKNCCMQHLHEDLHRYDSIKPERFSENDYRVTVWDTDTQSGDDWHTYNQELQKWESKAELWARHQLKNK